MLQTTYLSKPYQLEMTIPQACICLALNEADKVTLKSLIDNYGLTLEDLRKALKTNLCRPKVGVVKNSSGKPTFQDPNEEISINMKFTSQTFKKNFVPKLSPEQLIKSGFADQV